MTHSSRGGSQTRPSVASQVGSTPAHPLSRTTTQATPGNANLLIGGPRKAKATRNQPAPWARHKLAPGASPGKRWRAAPFLSRCISREVFGLPYSPRTQPATTPLAASKSPNRRNSRRNSHPAPQRPPNLHLTPTPIRIIKCSSKSGRTGIVLRGCNDSFP